MNAEELRPRTEAGRALMEPARSWWVVDDFGSPEAPVNLPGLRRRIIAIEDEARSNQLQVIERDRLARALHINGIGCLEAVVDMPDGTQLVSLERP